MTNQQLVWEEETKQLLSPVCRQCPEPHFQPRAGELPRIGCCAYEPVFTLYEIYRMVKEGAAEFFLNSIYRHPKNTVYDYEIIAGAYLHPLFYKKLPGEDISPFQRYEEWKGQAGTAYKAVDERLAYAMCQFFVDGKGCGLDPRFKTSICRSFICESVEQRLSGEERKKLAEWQRSIREEAEPFHRKHKAILQEKGMSLPENVHGIIEYFMYL
ncbi:hypothetical protein [Aneurinibacillus tyrosinisolvens]|jgi:hypothetical protein|uniref:hypothetical protein n=1 Tax=Aneurinibacillus tyrosinisolvens TaxID=1443435 RepID=UPI00063F3064|nr:hypothetical protein [Aneurinibacillus tyrosinisolvens]